MNNYADYSGINKTIEKYLNNKFPTSTIKIQNFDSRKLFYLKNYKEISTLYSNPIISLLALVNSESHNFTAESLFKKCIKYME